MNFSKYKVHVGEKAEPFNLLDSTTLFDVFHGLDLFKTYLKIRHFVKFSGFYKSHQISRDFYDIS